jgi:phage shock protein A
MEAEAEAGAEIAEEYTGDRLKQRFDNLEATTGGEEDLLELKRKMGLAPPAPAPAPTRVAPAPPAASTEEAEQSELAAALAELEVEQHRELQVKR